MQVAILTSGIVAGRMGLEARTLHGPGNLVQLHHVTRDRHGITPQGPVRATCFYRHTVKPFTLQNKSFVTIFCAVFKIDPVTCIFARCFPKTNFKFVVRVHPIRELRGLQNMGSSVFSKRQK